MQFYVEFTIPLGRTDFDCLRGVEIKSGGHANTTRLKEGSVIWFMFES